MKTRKTRKMRERVIQGAGKEQQQYRGNGTENLRVVVAVRGAYCIFRLSKISSGRVSWPRGHNFYCSKAIPPTTLSTLLEPGWHR